MTILCIETSTSVCSAAICKGGKPVSRYISREGSNHARLLPRYMEQLLDDAKQQGLTIDAVALSEGPGSYTGLRIGTATAKGLCYGLNVPLIPVQTLQILCTAAKENLVTSHQPTANSRFLPMIDARRMEVYTAWYDTDLTPLTDVKAVVVENEESVLCQRSGLSSVSEAVYYFGDGAAKCQNVLNKTNWHYLPDIVPDAQYMGVLAEQITNHKSPITNAKSIDLAYYEPFYLKEFIAAQSHVKGLK